MKNKNGKVICDSCKHEVTPRLWHHEGSLVNGREIEHICPICGGTMYTTGGEISFLGVILGSALLFYILYAVLMLTFGYMGMEEVPARIISITIVSMVFVNYFLKKIVGYGIIKLIGKWRGRI